MKVEEILTTGEGEKLFLLGNEAAVRGALEAGISFASTYPGTPSSEIGDTLAKIAKKAGMYFEFSVNEKVALEVSAAAAAAGLRSFVFMKHVGLNVAADALMSTVYTGVRGGMVILSADDPSMHSSQNEQDNRILAHLAGIPVLEPSDPQEVKDDMKFGIELSEQFQIPVMIRTTTRVSHMRSIVQLNEIKKPIREGFFWKKGQSFNIAPAQARQMRLKLIEKLHKIEEIANKASINQRMIQGQGSRIGVIASGASFNYIMDILKENSLKLPVLKLGLTYPFPKGLVKEFIQNLNEVFVAEEVEPVIEKEVLTLLGQEGWKKKIFGKLDGTLPRIYEYHPDILLKAFAKKLRLDFPENRREKVELLPPFRPPVLCPGCPHRSTIYAIKRAVKSLRIKEENIIYSNDIGCYTLAMQPPYNMADYCICMGSSIGVGSGLAKATNQKVIAMIGDSTFFHAGIPPLINAVHNQSNMMVVILDNRITAMTGGQSNPGLPMDGCGDATPAVSIEKIVRATGAGYVKVIDPKQLEDSVQVFQEGLRFDGVAVIIASSPCIMIKQKKKELGIYQINQDRCTRCQVCLKQLNCPAIYLDQEGQIQINPLLCTQCGYCVQVCPQEAIEVK